MALPKQARYQLRYTRIFCFAEAAVLRLKAGRRHLTLFPEQAFIIAEITQKVHSCFCKPNDKRRHDRGHAA